MAPLSTAIFYIASFIVGFSKTGFPGAGIVAIPIMAMVISPKLSIGVMLLLYMVGDVLSIGLWWRHAERHYCLPFLLFVGLGIWGASFVIGAVTDKTFGVIIGGLILSLTVLSLLIGVLRKAGNSSAASPAPIKPPLSFSVFFGFFTGLVSSLTNAAGPIMSLYLLLFRLEKFQMLGTISVCAFFMNWAKVPLFVSMGNINTDTLKLAAMAVPMVILGGLAGFFLAKKIPQKAFTNLVYFLSIAGSVNLILR